MHPKKFADIFKRISEIYSLDLFAEEGVAEGNFQKRNPSEPIWECIDDVHHDEFMDLGNGRLFPCRFLFKRPVRILFFILLTEFEARLFRIHERIGKDIAELNEKNTNDMIRELARPEIISLQKEYASRKEFKEDLKAISSFRNVVVHTNKKLEFLVGAETLVKRKRQLLKLLCALQQISDGVKKNAL